jgi:hypothetical protein
MTAPQKSVQLKYYMFDWDDNILHMPTRIHLEKKTRRGWKPVSVTTAEFARLRRDTVNYRPRGGDWDKAFLDFYDVGRRGSRAFLEDTKAALKPVIVGRARGAPSFHKFKKALVEGRLFAIITARSHSSTAIRRGVEYFIERVLKPAEKKRMIEHLRAYVAYFGGDPDRLTDWQILNNYLDLNHYRGVTSPEFQKLMGRRVGGSESPEKGKQFAIREFVNHVVAQLRRRKGHESVSVGFSDDDPHNVSAVMDYVRRELVRKFPHFRFVVYDTSNRGKRGGRKVVIQER